MRLDCVLLCDAVTVRDGLLHILGGGVGRVRRPAYPAPLDSDLALRVVLDRSEIVGTHKIAIGLVDGGGEVVAGVSGEFTTGVESGDPQAQEWPLAMPVTLRQLEIPAPGDYRVSVVVDGQEMASITLEAVPPGEQ
jgi:hypothetical protein